MSSILDADDGRNVNEAAKALRGVIDLLTQFYESPSLANTNALVLIDKELPVLRAALDVVQEAIDYIEWLEKGNEEWRQMCVDNSRQAKMAEATARIAIGHLQAVLNKCRTHAEQQAADTAARDWLTSIGSEPS